MANEGTLKVSRSTAIEYPSEEKETRIAIRRIDWNRIKRLVEFIRPEPKFLRTAYSISFGVAVTAGVTIIPIYYIPKKSPSLLPIYICFTVFPLVLAIVLFCVDKYYTTSKTKDLELIHKDIQDIEDTFKRETGEEEIDKSISASVSRSQSELEIIEAIYGTDKKNIDVTEKLRRHVFDNTLTIQVSNLFFGSDPDKGTTKNLRVKYSFAGKTHEKTVVETQGIYLP